MTVMKQIPFTHCFFGVLLVALALFGLAAWAQRILAGSGANPLLFNPDGSVSCAHLAALTANGKPDNRNDPCANDQDWALVNLLAVREIQTVAARSAAPGNRRFAALPIRRIK